jgi:hypothetical protein
MFLSKLPGAAIARALAAASLVLAIVMGSMPTASAQTAAIIPPSENHRWMGAMAEAYPRYGELKLSEALFPGAHDAGTFELNAAFSPDLPALAALQFFVPLQLLYGEIEKWSRTQNGDFTEQLRGGVRYLDLRLCRPIFAGDPVRFCHGLYGTTLESGLDQIAAFAADAAHSKEIVIVNVAATHGFSPELMTSTKQLIKTKLGGRMFQLPSSGGAAATLKSVWDSGKSLIVLADADGDGFWSRGWSSGAWPGQLDLATNDLAWLRNTVVANLACRCNSTVTTTPVGDHMFFTLEIQSTSDVPQQITNTWYQKAYPFGDQEGATDVTSGFINPAVLDKAHRNQNIIVTDFATEHGFVENIKNLTVAKLDLLHGKVAGRAYLSRTESPSSTFAAFMTTSSNGTHFGYTTPIQHGLDQIAPIYPTVAHFGNRLFAGDLKVTSIEEDFLTNTRTWNDGGTGFAVDLNAPGLPTGFSLPASYANAYGKLYVAWTALNGTMHYRSSTDGVSFPAANVHATGFSSSGVPVLATRMGMLYMVWMSPSGLLDYALIEIDGTFTKLGTVAGNLQARPAATGFGSDLIFAWSDKTDRKIRVSAVNPATGLQESIVTLSDMTDAPPSLAVFKESVVLAYTGQDKRRYTLVSSDGVTFPAADRSVEEPAFESTLAPPTLHAWGDRVNVTVGEMVSHGRIITPGTWTREDVTVTFSCEAPVTGVYGFLVDNGGAALDFVEGDVISVRISNPGQSTSVTCVDLSGNAASATADVKIDRTPPQITYLSSTPARPASGWHKTNVTAKFSCVDHESGVEQSQVEDVLEEGRSQLAFGTCVDKVGNSVGSNSTEIFDIDKTPPTVFVTGRTPAPNAYGWNNTAVNVGYFVSDALSGVSGDSISGVMFTNEGANQHRLVTVTDVAGNSANIDLKDPAAPINIDKSAPGWAQPLSITFHKTGPGPYEIFFGTNAIDVLSGLLSTVCDHPPGSLFPGGTTLVWCTATDKVGHTSTKSVSITVVVHNAAPAISVVAGGGPIDEGGSATITVTASDPDGDSINYAFDCNGDGIYEIAPQAGPTASCAFSDSGSRTVNVRVTDWSVAASSSTTVIVNNVAPSAVFSHSGPVDEGSSFMLTLSGATDPSSVDTSAGFTYAFNCGTAYGVFSPSNTVACPTAGSGAVNVRGKVRDKDGGERDYSASVTVKGIPPAITVPAIVSGSATGPDGATVEFDASALDALDGDVAINCSPASGSTFPLGKTTVTCTAADTRGNSASEHFDVIVSDVTGPRLTLPASFVSETGVAVAYVVSASDDVDGPVAISCAPLTGFIAGGGPITVDCSARDAVGNATPGSFVVTGVDTTKPVVSVPADITVDAANAMGAVASYAAVTASDAPNPEAPVLSCSHASGAVFPIGTTVVTCTARDASANIGTASFSVTVTDITTPGAMHGAGFVRQDGSKYDFAFRVEERAGERGKFTLDVRDERPRKGRSSDDRFVAHDITFIAFSDDPTNRAGRPRRPQVDTVRFSGTGSWNGANGYRFEVVAADEGEAARHRESVSITIWDSSGTIVAHVQGTLSGGYVQSQRIRH